ncbi:dihydropteroate synthase [Pontiellaceae bacterium B12227]|nr:dihydropteroate synthase [Pontiellaceae bacterium B12227]
MGWTGGGSVTPRSRYNWKCKDRTLVLGQRTLVMGILNTTPDSFSDGGDFSDPSAAVERALQMAAEGADLIDIGGESTRPGAEPVSVKEEILRTVPIIGKIRAHSDVPISIDTMKAETAFQALEAGADIINDVSAFEADPEMAGVAAESKAGVVLMHMKGSPKTMQDDPNYGNAVQEILHYLQSRIDYATERGVDADRIMIDPGIGFGKTVEHNLELLRTIPMFGKTAPVLIGASRKSLIGHLLNREDPAQRLAGSLGVAGWSALCGAHILRVHDVIDTCDVCRIVDTLCEGDL